MADLPKLTDRELTALANFLGASHRFVWQRMIKGRLRCERSRGLDINAPAEPQQFLSDWFGDDVDELLDVIAQYPPYSAKPREALMAVAVQIMRFQPIFRERMSLFTEEQVQMAVDAIKAQHPEIWERELVRQAEGEDWENDPVIAQDKVHLQWIVESMPIQWVEWDKAFHSGRLLHEVYKRVRREFLEHEDHLIGGGNGGK